MDSLLVGNTLDMQVKRALRSLERYHKDQEFRQLTELADRYNCVAEILSSGGLLRDDVDLEDLVSAMWQLQIVVSEVTGCPRL